MDLHLDLKPGLPLKVAVESAVRTAIRTGRLRAADPLPSTRALAAQLGVARGTVVEAYAQLAAEGWLITRQGAPARIARGGDGGGSGGSGGDSSPGRPAAAPAADPVPIPGPYPAAAPVRWDLRPGVPDPSLFPGRAWAAAVRAATHSGAEVFGYGDPRGRPELRRALTDYLGRARDVLATPAQTLVTSGFADGLGLVAGALHDLGLRDIAMEDPCLDVHRTVVARAGLTVHPVPVDADGLDITALAATPARAVLTTAAHQFPMGVTLSPARRRKLVEWARRVDGYVIEDDYDGEYRFDRKPVSALQALDPARVVYGGTASKALAPAMRLGWLVLPPRLCRPVIDRVARQQAPPLDQLALAQLIRDGHFDRQVRRTRGEYGRRRDHLVAAGLPLTGIPAGLHAVLSVPDEKELIVRARQRSLALLGLAPFWHGPPRTQGVIVGYSRLPRSTVYAALDQLIELAGGARPGAARR
ncbi:PLP-dependent aminotransferase family protein [Streptomyces sp. NPDC057654]|uniref:MocR-like pyridoxine biosynthesis transcription factor PdxR n=1 Tax=Streptomyces sp. NPDC057654 TaxID=3346196 RepID=UPI0036CA2541